ncbi:MAG: A/G-specific adenine glycosylase [Ruminococcaceae bacterium]|nr:A/G-specific adenine glycosylase [Oscillospiraceae bacterium]
MRINSDRLALIVPLLCRWFEENRIDMPWRRDPTPYHVWISEIMLQQTRIEAVIPYYERFICELPTVKALSEVSEDRLMKLWQGLGYYSRARNLKKAAETVMREHNGELPRTAEALRKLPGIGDYTAGAIASIACGEAEPAVDGNVLRVVMRLYASDADIMQQRTRRAVTDALREVYPSGEDAGRLTEGLMELGEQICIPNGMPRCEACPIRAYCCAAQEGNPEKYPTRIVKKERRIEEKTVFLLIANGRYAIRKRTESGLLAGMWEFPNVDADLSLEQAREFALDFGLKPQSLHPCGKAKHIFSHVEWHMKGYTVHCEVEEESYEWVTPDELRSSYAIPTAFRAFMKQIP